MLVLALPRGGVPVAAEVAAVLDAPLDVAIVRKVGAPGQAELALGAVAEKGVVVIDRAMAHDAGVDDHWVHGAIARAQAEVDARSLLLRGRHGVLPITGRIALLIDDGIATGSSMTAACQVVRARCPSALLVAAPVAARGAIAKLGDLADRVIALHVPAHFASVGQWYQDFDQVTEEEVEVLLDAAEHAARTLRRATLRRQ